MSKKHAERQRQQREAKNRKRSRKPGFNAAGRGAGAGPPAIAALEAGWLQESVKTNEELRPA